MLTSFSVKDPIEIRAIAKTLGAARSQSERDEIVPLFLGSVKTNVGHTEGCSGIAGVIKAVHSLETGWIPPVVGLSNVNPEISPVLSKFHMALPIDIVRWPETPRNLRRASVNSFGFGGSNAHIILDDAASYLETKCMEGVHATAVPNSVLRRRVSHDSDSAYSSGSGGSEVQSPLYPPPPGSNGLPYELPSQLADKSSSQARLYLLSAHDEEGLRRVAESYARYLEEEKDQGYLADPASSTEALAHILATKSSHHYFRGFTVADRYEELLANLQDTNDLLPPKRASQHNNVVFVFTGQGAQRPGMARELLGFPAFAASICRSQDYLTAVGCDWDIRDVLSTASADIINRPEYSQPLCTAVQIALVHLLSEWNVRPAAVVGHSSGEIVAALAAGAISHEDAIRVSWYRGQLSAELPSRSSLDGAMLAAGLSESDAERYIASLGLANVNVACVNSPSSVTLAGPRDAITELLDHLVEDGKFGRLLRTSVAYHSPQMVALADDYAAALATLERPRSTNVPMYSSVTEGLIGGEQLDAEYWLSNMKNPVRFAGALANLLKSSTKDITGEYSAVLEIGPTKTLEGPIRQIIAGVSSRLGDKLPYISMLVHGQDAYRAGLKAAGQLWATGHSIDMDKVNQTSCDTSSSLGPLLARRPAYPWSHKHDFWHDTLTSRSARTRDRPRTDLLGVSVDGQNPFEPRWRNILNTMENPWLLDHNVASAVLFPAAGYLVMALEAVMTLVHRVTDEMTHNSIQKAVQGVEFLDVKFESGLVIPEGRSGVEVSLTVKADDVLPDLFEFATYTVSKEDAWTRLCRGHVQIVRESEVDDDFGRRALQEEWEAQRSGLREISESAECIVDVKEFYAQLNSLGLKYGRTFQGLAGIKTAPGGTKVWGRLEVPDTKAVMPNQFEYPHLIHPATLDSAFQLVFASLEAQDVLFTAAVPTSVKRIFIAADLPRDAGSMLNGTADARRVDAINIASAEKGARATISADVVFTDEHQTAPKVVIEDIRLQDVAADSFGDEDEAHSTLLSSTRRSARVIWKEDVELLDMNDGFDTSPELPRHKPEVTEPTNRLLFWLDRLCHKQAGLDVAFVGMDARHEHILLDKFGPRPSLDCRFNSVNTLAINEIQGLAGTNRNTSKSYDVIFFGGSLPPNVERLLPTILAPNGKLILCDECSPTGNEPSDRLQPLIQDGHYHKILDLVSQKQHAAVGPSRVVILARSGLPSTRPAGLISDLQSIVLLERDESERPTTPQYCYLRDSLCSNLKSLGIAISQRTISSCAPGSLVDAVVISLLECDEAWVYTWSSDNHVRQFRDLITQARYVLWVTTGGIAVDHGHDDYGYTHHGIDYLEDMLKYAPTPGLLRSVRAEYPHLTLPHLDISRQGYGNANGDGTDVGVKVILEVLRCTNVNSSHAGSSESEFAERNGRLLIPRVVGDQFMDDGIQSNLANLGQDTPQVVDDTESKDELSLGPDEVLVRLVTVAVEATKDSDDQHTVLREAIAIVEGRGQRVLGCAAGSYVLCLLGAIEGPGRTSQSVGIDHGDSVRLHRKQVIELPAVFTGSTSTLPRVLYWIGPLVQAWNVLSRGGFVPNNLDQARFATSEGTESESLLIDIADDALREALLHLCRCLGLRQILVVGLYGDEISRQDKTGQASMNTTYIPRLSRGAAQAVLRATHGKGVGTVVTSSHHLPSIMHLVPALASCGRVIMVDAEPKSQGSLARYATLTGGNVSVLSTRTLQMADDTYWEICRSLLALVADDQLQPADWAVSSDVHHSNVASGDLLQTLTSGHVELERHPRSTIALLSSPSSSPSRPVTQGALVGGNQPVLLDPNGTYVIAGGLGALGLEVASWLFQQGAGRVLLLSRSGKTSDPSALSALESFSQRQWDCRVVKCDITSASSVLSLASMCVETASLPIRGIIQCAMVLQDSMLENMTIDKWCGAVNPKVRALTEKSFDCLKSMLSIHGWPRQDCHFALDHARSKWYIDTDHKYLDPRVLESSPTPTPQS